VAEVEKMVPEFSLTEYLKSMVPSGYAITPDTTVIVTDINYFKNLSTIIKISPRESVHDYFVSRIISTWAGRLHKNFTAPSRAFSNSLGGKDPNNITPRWRVCINDIDTNLGYILGAAFVQRSFSTADKSLGDRIISDIKDVFKAKFKDFEWMSEEVKQKAANKGMKSCHQKTHFAN
jgi:endothelin-converting enzyme